MKYAPGIVWTGAYTPGDDAAAAMEAPDGNIVKFPGSGSTTGIPHVSVPHLALVVGALVGLDLWQRKARAKRSS